MAPRPLPRPPLPAPALLLPLLLLCTWLPEFSCRIAVEDIIVPEGFAVNSFANGEVPMARSLALSGGDNGGATIVYVSTRKLTNVYAVIDEDSDGTGDRVVTVIDDRDTPNGIAWRNGSLYLAQIDAVWRYDDVDEQALRGEKLQDPILISDAFPSDPGHGWKFIRFGPDGKLYIPVGAPCNICELEDFGDIAYGTINCMSEDGSDLEIYATGVRNTVGFDWHPFTRELWFTDNGRDRMGDNLPDDELNIALEKGLDFGYPYCHTEGEGDPYNRPAGAGKVVPDTTFGTFKNCSDPESHQLAVQPLGPHVAALGMRFYTGTMFPERYWNSAFIALHGSWNREDKIGYSVLNVRLGADNRTVESVETFAGGWLLGDGDTVCGRPVDVEIMPDGSLLVSDDYADDVYRITYTQQEADSSG